MRFSVFSVVAALACSAFTSAMPAAQPAPVVMQARELEARHEERGVIIKSVPQILAEATSALEGPIDDLYAFTESTLTEGALAPILLDINTILATAVSQTLLLVGETLDTILTSVDGTVVMEISDVAVLVANFVCYIVNALYTVAGIVNYDLSILGTELDIVESTLSSLISEIEKLIAPILNYLTPLVASLVTPLADLLWNNLAAVLGLA